MRCSDTPFPGCTEMIVHTDHGLQRRYMTEAGRVVPNDSPSTESRKASHGAALADTAQERTPEADEHLLITPTKETR